MERDIKTLLGLADRYCQETGLSHARVSMKILNSSRFFGRLKSGGDCTTRIYDKVHAWLVEHLRSDCGYIASTEGTVNPSQNKVNEPKIRTRRYFIIIPHIPGVTDDQSSRPIDSDKPASVRPQTRSGG